MLTLSESAINELNEFFKDRDKAPIRIYLAPGGCGGPRLALALDAPGNEDEIAELNGFTFCINKDLFVQTGEISVDVTCMGFAVESANPMGGGGCAGCASNGGCASAQ